MRTLHQTLGVVGLLRNAGTAPGARDELAYVEAITSQIGLAVLQWEQRQQAEQGKLLAERERLGMDLHDTIIQSVYGLVALAEAGLAQLEGGETHSGMCTLERIASTARQALRETRLFVHELRPGILEQYGLVAALQLRLDAVEGRADIRTRLVSDELVPLTPEVEIALYRIAQEALNNSLRHASANNVSVSLRCRGDRVILGVSDDGSGFDPRQVASGAMGLANMRAYADEVGAELHVRTAATRGTLVRVVARRQMI